jgi:hypothetical protein
MNTIDSLKTCYRALRRSTANYFYWKKFVSQLQLKAFAIQHQHKIVLIVKKAHLDVARLFLDDISEIVTVDYFRLELLAQKSEYIPGRPFLAHPSRLSEDLDHVLGAKGVNLLDLYKRLLRLSENSTLTKPNVHPESAKNAFERFRANKLPVGKTVILAPTAHSISMLPLAFWCDLASQLNQIGWTVCTTSLDDSSCIPHTLQLRFPLDEAIPIVEQAGWIISIRSGLCDLVATAKCQLSIIYPREKWHAGTPLSAASLVKMGLSSTALEYEVGTFDDLHIVSKMIINRELATAS